MNKNLYEQYSLNRSKLDELVHSISDSRNDNRQNTITQLKKICDFDELRIVNQIYSGQLNYDETYRFLEKKKHCDFLEDSYKIRNFLTTRGITKTVTNYKNKRESVKSDYQELCKTVWSDGIITKEERKKLDDYCKKNKIDSITQHFLETEILNELNILDLNFQKIIEFYYRTDNLNSKEIQGLLKRDYKQIIDITKIENVLEDIQKRNNDLNINNEDIKHLYSLKFEKKQIQVISTNSKLNTCYNFEIAFHRNNIYDDFKIILKKEIVNRNNNAEIIDAITDAICYKSTTNNNLSEFLEMKDFVRNEVNKQINKNNF